MWVPRAASKGYYRHRANVPPSKNSVKSLPTFEILRCRHQAWDPLPWSCPHRSMRPRLTAVWSNVLSCVVNGYDELFALVLYHVIIGYTHDFRKWASQRMRRESIVNNSIEEQALPLAINGISELNMKKTIIHVSQEKWIWKKKKENDV